MVPSEAGKQQWDALDLTQCWAKYVVAFRNLSSLGIPRLITAESSAITAEHRSVTFTFRYPRLFLRSQLSSSLLQGHEICAVGVSAPFQLSNQRFDHLRRLDLYPSQSCHDLSKAMYELNIQFPNTRPISRAAQSLAAPYTPRWFP